MNTLNEFDFHQANVLRDREWKFIEPRFLVPGDVVKIKSGDKVPADIILYEANEMKVNNASLTGEPEELLRKCNDKSSNIFESSNVAFMHTYCT